MSFARVATLGRGAPRLSTRLGFAGRPGNSGNKPVGFSSFSGPNPKILTPKPSSSTAFAFSPSVRTSALRALGGGGPYAHPPALFAAVPAAGVAAPSASRFLSSSNNGQNAAGSSSNNTSTAATAPGGEVGEASGVEGEGVGTRPFQEETTEPPDGDEIQKVRV